MITFCDFNTSYAGPCGMPLTNGEQRCKKHIHAKEVVKKTLSPRFRGDSKWQVEQGLGNYKTGSNV